MTVLEKLQDPAPIKFTIEEFLHLDEIGVFRKYAKTELIGGTIVAMNAQLSQHARFKSRLFRRLADAVETAMPGYEAWVEVTVAIPPSDLPQPDIVVTCFSPSSTRAPVPVETIALVMGIADTTVRYDLGPKAALYASAGIPEYWVADVGARRLHVFSAPSPEGYAERREAGFGERLEAVSLPLAIDIPEA